MTMKKLRQKMFVIPFITIQLLAVLLMLAELNMSEYRELFQNDGEMSKATASQYPSSNFLILFNCHVIF